MTAVEDHGPSLVSITPKRRFYTTGTPFRSKWKICSCAATQGGAPPETWPGVFSGSYVSALMPDLPI